MDVGAIYCALVEKCFQPNQEVVTYKTCPMSARDTLAALRSPQDQIDEVVKQWMLDTGRSIRDYIARHAERCVCCAVTTTDYVFPAIFLIRLISEVREDRIVFYLANRAYSAATLARLLNSSATIYDAYAHRFGSLLFAALEAQAKVSPQIKSKPVKV